ncbi:MAG: threonylcarbamoyl-AMP synthase [Firmicutes bacterium]|nr:threonylcarbamoyl-AMP synthase [Bacillota bacterium]
MAWDRHSTRLLAVDRYHPDRAAVCEAGAVLRGGGLVAFPTETVYGLGANALDAGAVERIFEAKGRPADNPLIVHLNTYEALERYFPGLPVAVPELARRFWPGPLTLVLEGGARFPPAVTGGLATVAVRIPSHPVALALITAAGVPVAAPSANLSGRPSPTTAAHVLDDLDGRIDLVLDGGPSGLGVESTVLDLSGDRPVILRPGGITLSELEAALGSVQLDSGVDGGPCPEKPRSPGMKYTHYAPRAPLIVFDGSDADRVSRCILLEAELLAAAGFQVGVMACDETASLYDGLGYTVIKAGRRADPATVAAVLYETLRRFDRLNVDTILAEGVPAVGMGLAVMNRLRRAAGGNVVPV